MTSTLLIVQFVLAVLIVIVVASVANTEVEAVIKASEYVLNKING